MVRRVLIAEDDVSVALAMRSQLTVAGFEVCGVAMTGPVAVALAEVARPDIALIDLRLADGPTGVSAARHIGASGRTVILYITADTDQARRAGIGAGCLAKPFELVDLIRATRIVQQLARGGAAGEDMPKGLELYMRPRDPRKLA